jgi:hypothetical protein
MSVRFKYPLYCARFKKLKNHLIMTEQSNWDGNCINCNKPVNTPYCSQCGQPNPPQRISLGQISADVQGRAYGTGGLFPRTLRDLLTKPGHVVASYINGNRVTYSRPVGYFLLMITILLVLINILNVDYAALMEASSPKDETQNAAQVKLQHDIYQFMINNLRLMSLVIIPLQAFCARWFFFRKRGFSYFEHTVLPFYTNAQINLLSIFAVLLFAITGWPFPFWLTMALSISYFAYAYVGWIESQSKIKVFLKGVGIYVIAMVLMILLAIVGAAFYFIFNPDLLKTFQSQP